MKRRQAAPDSVAACRQLSLEAAGSMERGQWGQARQLLEQAVATSPSDLDARRQLAESMWQSGSRQEAAVQMEAAVRLDPRHTATLVRSGEMLLELGAPDRALSRAEEAIALDPAFAGAWALRGRVFKRQSGQEERALADLHQALRYSPHAADVLADVGELQFRLARPQRSLTTLRQAIEAAPQGPDARRAHWISGLAYSAIGRPEEAAASLLAASQAGPADPSLLYALATAQQAVGRPHEAAATARMALAADGTHEPSRALLARLEAGTPGGEGVVRR